MAIRRAMPDFATDDIEAPTAFYVDVLGFEVVMERGWIVTLSAAPTPKRSSVS